jgi:hypothetical protein
MIPYTVVDQINQITDLRYPHSQTGGIKLTTNDDKVRGCLRDHTVCLGKGASPSCSPRRGKLASLTYETRRRDLQNAQIKREKVILQQQREERRIFRIRSAMVVKGGKLSGDLWCSFGVLNPGQPTVVIRTKCQSIKIARA